MIRMHGVGFGVDDRMDFNLILEPKGENYVFSIVWESREVCGPEEFFWSPNEIVWDPEGPFWAPDPTRAALDRSRALLGPEEPQIHPDHPIIPPIILPA